MDVVKIIETTEAAVTAGSISVAGIVWIACKCASDIVETWYEFVEKKNDVKARHAGKEVI